MEAKLVDFAPRAPRNPGAASATVAQVLVAEGGSALWVGDPRGDHGHRVAGHLCSVPRLTEGDQVLITVSPAGAYVLGRLRSPGEAPALAVGEEDGAVRIEGGRSLTLQAGNSRIELTADGCVLVDGREIHGFAEGRMCLQGATIELN